MLLAWALPAYQGDPMAWAYYESHGLVPYARVVFALMLGVAVGAVSGHTRIAMPLSMLLTGVVQFGGRMLRERADSSYWVAQRAETVLYLVLALALAVLALLAVRRRA
ncbi:hypothetical protein ACFQYP_11875 [Nonomuraea antimicrobica]